MHLIVGNVANIYLPFTIKGDALNDANSGILNDYLWLLTLWLSLELVGKPRNEHQKRDGEKTPMDTDRFVRLHLANWCEDL